MEHGLSVLPLLVRYLCVTQLKYQRYPPNRIKKHYSCNFFLSLDVGYTNNGAQCRTRCKFYGGSENKCRTGAGDWEWEYCTPTGEFFINILRPSQTKFQDGHLVLEEMFIITDPCNKWPENYFEKNNGPNETLVKELHQYGRQNLALIHVMVQIPYVTKIKRDVAMPFITFVANSGGLLGLCIGFSFISAIEICFWISCCCRSFSKIAFSS